MASKNPNSNPKAGAIAFGITALSISALFGFSLPAIISGAVLGLLAGKVISIMASGLDTTTHNKQDILRQKEEEAKRIPLTGNETADSVILRGQELLQLIEAENAAIPDPDLSGKMSRLSERVLSVLRTVSEDPSMGPRVRKFINYYLPTAGKILANYRVMEDRGVNPETLREARDSASRGLDMILTACDKQIDDLHRDNLLDIDTDINVLEQMLKRDGYSGDGFSVEEEPIPPAAEARTAAEAQMRQTDTPVLDFSAAGHTTNESASQYFNRDTIQK